MIVKPNRVIGFANHNKKEIAMKAKFNAATAIAYACAVDVAGGEPEVVDLGAGVYQIGDKSIGLFMTSGGETFIHMGIKPSSPEYLAEIERMKTAATDKPPAEVQSPVTDVELLYLMETVANTAPGDIDSDGFDVVWEDELGRESWTTESISSVMDLAIRRLKGLLASK